MIGLGLGRFSLGMLLPSMGASLELSYSQMGLIGTGNFLGYMVSVVLAGIVARSIGARWTISLGLFLVGSSMVFIVTAMINERGFGENTAGTFSMAFWLCAFLTGAAVSLTSFLRPPPEFGSIIATKTQSKLRRLF